jgi:integrase
VLRHRQSRATRNGTGQSGDVPPKSYRTVPACSSALTSWRTYDYADLTEQITLRRNDFSKDVGMTRMSAQSCLCRHPHKHDLRHCFAVSSMLDAYRAGEDGQTRLTLLSTWLGHVHPANTYRSLSASPELMAVVGQRLEPHLAGRA